MSLLQDEKFQEFGKTFFQPFDTNFLISVILLKGAFIMGKFERYIKWINKKYEFSGLLFKDIILGGIKNLPDEIYAEPLASASRTLIIPEYLSRKDKNNQMKVHKGPPSSFSTFQPQNTNVHIPLKSKHHLDSNIVYGNDPVSEYDYDEYLYDYEYPYQNIQSFQKEQSYQ